MTLDSGNSLEKFMLNFNSPEKLQANAESVRALVERFNSGAPIPPVSASDIKQLWDASRRMNADMPPRSDVAIGLGVYLAYGVEAAVDPERFMAVQWRHTVLSDLLERAVLADYLRDSEPDDRVFAAAATMPCTKDDLGQAMLPQVLAQMPSEEAVKMREEMKASGFDPAKPNIDSKFIRWLQDSC
jgi:hypothetical protein